jgi:hypothetical protein
VCHYPPGISKWNRIEHRLFSFISKNWRVDPSPTSAPSSSSSPPPSPRLDCRFSCAYDPNWYPTGEKISDADFNAIPLHRHDWHGDWN